MSGRAGLGKWSKGDKRALAHYSRARAAGSDTDYRAEDWGVLVAWFGGCCLACSATPVTIDHVVPLSQGGCNTIRNLQPLCAACNARKGQRTTDYRDLARLVQVLDLIGGSK